MSLHHHLPDPTAGASQWTLSVPKALGENAHGDGDTRPGAGRDSRPQASAKTTEAAQQKIEPRVLQPSERDIMLGAVPRLRAFAVSLSGNADRADDLVQGTLMRAMANINLFKPGTNMTAWLFTIFRNLHRSEYRKRRREVEDADGKYFDSLKSPPEQHSRLELKQLFDALATLPLNQREALLLVGASGFSYDRTAAICGTAVGTIKSRVNRARRRLAELLVIDNAGRLGPPPATAEVETAQ
jgi:RNA polymerase sigma-70 factor, ECF subfamily